MFACVSIRRLHAPGSQRLQANKKTEKAAKKARAFPVRKYALKA
jgi:hypothetical protein